MDGAEPRPARGGRIGIEREGAGGRSDTVSFAAGAGCFGPKADSAGLVGGAAGAAAGLGAGFLDSTTPAGAWASPPRCGVRSIDGRDGGASAAEAEPTAAGRECGMRRRRSSRAVSSSIELEWVFFSEIPSSGSISRITPGLTSRSLASSLMRIFFIFTLPAAVRPRSRTALASRNDYSLSLGTSKVSVPGSSCAPLVTALPEFSIVSDSWSKGSGSGAVSSSGAGAGWGTASAGASSAW